jgi:hypothetical protein
VSAEASVRAAQARFADAAQAVALAALDLVQAYQAVRPREHPQQDEFAAKARQLAKAVAELSNPPEGR